MIKHKQQGKVFTPERLYYVIQRTDKCFDNQPLNCQLRTMSDKTDIEKTTYAREYIESDKWGKKLNPATVLMLSHCFGKTLTTDLLQQFIADGADVNTVCDNGQSVLIRTLLNFDGKLCDDLVEILLKNGAKTKYGTWNSIFIARQISTLNLLLSYGAKIDRTSHAGFYMTAPRDKAVIKWLIDNGILKHKDTKIDLSSCLADFDIETAKLWLDSGIFNKAKKNETDSMLYMSFIFDDALFKGRFDIIKLLLENDFNINEDSELANVFVDLDSYKTLADNNISEKDNDYVPVFNDFPQNTETLNAIETIGNDLNIITGANTFFDLDVSKTLISHGARFSEKSPLLQLIRDTELQQIIINNLNKQGEQQWN